MGNIFFHKMYNNAPRAFNNFTGRQRRARRAGKSAREKKAIKIKRRDDNAALALVRLRSSVLFCAYVELTCRKQSICQIKPIARSGDLI